MWSSEKKRIRAGETVKPKPCAVVKRFPIRHYIGVLFLIWVKICRNLSKLVAKLIIQNSIKIQCLANNFFLKINLKQRTINLILNIIYLFNLKLAHENPKSALITILLKLLIILLHLTFISSWTTSKKKRKETKILLLDNSCQSFKTKQK